MRPTCLICGKEFESTRCVGNGDMQKFWICDSCLADAALGRAVRRMKAGMTLWCHAPTEWGFDRDEDESVCVDAPTPEAALQAAGLMDQDVHERLKKANERRNCGADDEIARLRAENERLREALGNTVYAYTKRFETADGKLFGPIDSEIEDASSALRAEQKQETCVWKMDGVGWLRQPCNRNISKWDSPPKTCPNCGKKVEVKE